MKYGFKSNWFDLKSFGLYVDFLCFPFEIALPVYEATFSTATFGALSTQTRRTPQNASEVWGPPRVIYRVNRGLLYKNNSVFLWTPRGQKIVNYRVVREQERVSA